MTTSSSESLQRDFLVKQAYNHINTTYIGSRQSVASIQFIQYLHHTQTLGDE